jgi:NADH:ubiquinone oxidoreductase subunit 2 (subunit N)
MITIAANLACMMVFFYLRKNGIMFREFDIARYTTIAVVFSAVIVCIIGIARHKKKDDTFEVVTLSTLISLVGSFIGSVSGAVISANIFGKIT